ncbi:MAG: hypothetical protein QNJ47_15250 [Nostocaceae cyanobacterium]|nr:hypothetical protein [Nostocaceae cyanobacterium]
MNKNYKIFCNSAKVLGAICGGLMVSLAAIPQAAIAELPIKEPVSKVNPCPSIFYEKPHDDRVLVPNGCTPNAFTRKMIEQGMISVPTVPVTPTAEQIRLGVGGETSTGTVNPCPRIYYEEPFSERNIVPLGCPPNALTMRLEAQGITPEQRYPYRQRQVGVIQPPAPETRSLAIATVIPINGRIDVKLRNNTNTPITYQAIGHTGERTLLARQEVTLRGLSLPLTLTTIRQDEGFLRIIPISTSETGVLELSLDETTNFSQSQTSIMIQPQGGVYVN